MIVDRIRSLSRSRFLKSMSTVALGTLVAQPVALASLACHVEYTDPRAQ